MSKKSFTLIELLIAISIIGLLASIVFVWTNSARAKARDAKRIAESDTLRKGLEMHYADNDEYPGTTGWIKIEEDDDTNGPFSLATQLYFPQMPRDPLYPKEVDDKIFSYQYKSTEDEQGYKIHIEMETGEYASYEVYSEGGGGITYGEDQVQSCVNNSSAYVAEWIWYTDPVEGGKVDKVRIGGLANDCSGLLLTIILSGDLPNDGCGVGADPELGRASSIIPNDGDNQNMTTVDFVPDILIQPIECINADVS